MPITLTLATAADLDALSAALAALQTAGAATASQLASLQQSVAQIAGIQASELKDAANIAALQTAVAQLLAGVPQPPPPSTATVLLREAFDDANLKARGWYDNSADAGTATIDGASPHSGVGSLRWDLPIGVQTPTQGSSIRHAITATDRVYVRYAVRYSTNWAFGSGADLTTDTIHELYLLTTGSGMWTGPGSQTPLTAYLQHRAVPGGAAQVVKLQDGANILTSPVPPWGTFDPSRGAVCGCNGNPGEGQSALDCYASAGWHNAKSFFTTSPQWSETSKSSWHTTAMYLQMNTVAGGIAQADGVIRAWFDGALTFERTAVRLRAATQPTLLFNQVLLGPYLAVPSPVTEALWMDDLVVATGVVP